MNPVSGSGSSAERTSLPVRVSDPNEDDVDPLAADASDTSDGYWYAVFLAPLALYLIAGALIPAVWQRATMDFDSDPGPSQTLATVAVTLAAVGGMLAWSVPRATRVFPLRISPAAWLIGLVGGVVWIVLAAPAMEGSLLEAVGGSTTWLGTRAAVDPWTLFADAGSRVGFLVCRFAVLVVAVPLAEELMLRGFLIRAVEREAWATMPLSQVTRTGLIAATVYGVVAHPAEAIAAAVWFSMVTWWMVRSGRFWDCVVIHAVTNAVLGLYVVASGDWRLW